MIRTFNPRLLNVSRVRIYVSCFHHNVLFWQSLTKKLNFKSILTCCKVSHWWLCKDTTYCSSVNLSAIKSLEVEHNFKTNYVNKHLATTTVLMPVVQLSHFKWIKRVKLHFILLLFDFIISPSSRFSTV